MRNSSFLIPVFILVAANVHAQTTDEQLLYAQNAYQQAFSLQSKVRARFDDAQSTLKGAQSRLNEAQQAVQKAEQEIAAAQAAKASADSTMEQAAANLRAAWQRKESGAQ